MARLKRIEDRLAALEKKMAAFERLKVVSDAPVYQLVSAQTDTAIPIKSGPAGGEINLEAGTINLR